MGFEVYLYLKAGRHSYVARVKTERHVSINEKLPMHFNMQKAHFFDKETEEAIV